MVCRDLDRILVDPIREPGEIAIEDISASESQYSTMTDVSTYQVLFCMRFD